MTRGGRPLQVRCAAAAGAAIATDQAKESVLGALRKIIDPDFGMDIVSCGFVKELEVEAATGKVSFVLELTTPACPIKDQFEQQALENVRALPWVTEVKLKMTAQPPKPLVPTDVPPGLAKVSNIIAVSSCKGGVGKSTVAVNLAYSLAMMGARVGIFDADIYGPSLPTMVSPELRVLQMDAQTKAITPTEYLGVKLVSFGFAGQGSAIMRGPMVSGVVNQLLTTTDWGELDYLVLDFPPGTGDIQLTLCQVVPITAAVVVTTPQRLAFIDVAKGIRMFSKLRVPCVSVVENMSYFEVDGVKHYPFGTGSGAEVVERFGIPHLFQMPMVPLLSAAGDTGEPAVVKEPRGIVGRAFSDVAVSLVQEVAKLRSQIKNAVAYDEYRNVIVLKVPGANEEILLHPATVRRNDQSAASIDEWTGEQRLRPEMIPEDIKPQTITPVGNYAVSIQWSDGFNQVAPFDQLQAMERVVGVPAARSEADAPKDAGKQAGVSSAMSILAQAESLKQTKQ
eukprot:jgi/Mesvir1/17251/Mv07662-RA.1